MYLPKRGLPSVLCSSTYRWQRPHNRFMGIRKLCGGLRYFCPFQKVRLRILRASCTENPRLSRATGCALGAFEENTRNQQIRKQRIVGRRERNACCLVLLSLSEITLNCGHVWGTCGRNVVGLASQKSGWHHLGTIVKSMGVFKLFLDCCSPSSRKLINARIKTVPMCVVVMGKPSAGQVPTAGKTRRVIDIC